MTNKTSEAVAELLVCKAEGIVDPHERFWVPTYAIAEKYKRMEEALKFYSDDNNFGIAYIVNDKGQTARQALAFDPLSSSPNSL